MWDIFQVQPLHNAKTLSKSTTNLSTLSELLKKIIAIKNPYINNILIKKIKQNLILFS